MVAGMLLACLAFVVAGIVQIRVQTVQDTLSQDQSKVVIYNTVPGSSLEYHFYKEEDSSIFQNGTLPFQKVSLLLLYLLKLVTYLLKLVTYLLKLVTYLLKLVTYLPHELTFKKTISPNHIKI